jgi:uncharacterized membrane protein YqiK
MCPAVLALVELFLFFAIFFLVLFVIVFEQQERQR